MKKALLVLSVLSVLSGFWPAAAQTEPAVADVKDYQIGVEDELRVFIWGENDLSVKVKVRPDGKITVPLANDVYVVGLTSDEVREKVREALKTYINEPVVTVIVESINSYRIFFLGEVRKQGVINFYRPIRLLQAIAAAGGLTEFASKDIVLLREEGAGETRTEISYKRLVAGDRAEANVYLRDGDTLLFK